MKHLKTHLHESVYASILTDIETTLNNGDKNNWKAIRTGVIQFLKENYSGRFKVSAKPNTEGKFEVSAKINDIIMINNDAEALTNGNFIFTNIAGESKSIGFYVGSNKLKDLTGAPRYVDSEFVINDSPELESLVGCENTQTYSFKLIKCPKLKSLKGMPFVKSFIELRKLNILNFNGFNKNIKKLNILRIYDMPNLKDISDINIDESSIVDICSCSKLESIKGVPNKITDKLDIAGRLPKVAVDEFPKKCNKILINFGKNKNIDIEQYKNSILNICNVDIVYIHGNNNTATYYANQK